MKSRINHHIETGIGSNLKSRLSSDLQVNIESHEQEMIERMTALLPAERQQFSRNILPRRDSFEVLYHLHFDNLCADFQEDIRFKFSLGFSALLKKFMSFGQSNRRQKGYVYITIYKVMKVMNMSAVLANHAIREKII